MGYSINLDRAALVLVEAAFFGDTQAAKRWQLSPRTIENYRKRLNTDSELSEKFAIKKQEFEANWIEEIPAALRAGTRFLITAIQELEPTAENIYAVTGMMKILTEIGLTKELIDARLGKFSIESRETDNKVVGRIATTSTDQTA